MSSTFGEIFRIHTFGESHGGGVGVVIDGCPSRVPVALDDIQAQLDRRRPGQSEIVTPRKEADTAEVLSGIHDGHTLGSPIAILVRNTDHRPGAYDEMAVKYRPSHADFTYDAKYGIRAIEGGGRASARETVGRVAAGAIAKEVLAAAGVEVCAWVSRVADLEPEIDPDTVTREAVEANAVRCPDPEAAAQMAARIDAARKRGDSLGGVVGAIARGVPAGLGEPVFDKLEADLAKAMLSIPAAKGFEIGSGFAGTLMTGSEHNDRFTTDDDRRIRTETNRSGGIQGGISNGEPIALRVAFKPTATILRDQPTLDREGQPGILKPRGRHDPCVLPRAVPIVEAMIQLVLVDHWLRHRGQCGG